MSWVPEREHDDQRAVGSRQRPGSRGTRSPRTNASGRRETMNPLLATELARLHREDLVREAELDRLALEATADSPSALERMLGSLADLTRVLRRRAREQVNGIMPQGTLGATRPPRSIYEGTPPGMAAPNTVPLL